MINRFKNLYHHKENNILFIMICMTSETERFANYKKQKNKIKNLALFEAITPKCSEYKKKDNVNFERFLGEKYTCLWLSQLSVFEFFLNSKFDYLCLFEDDVEPDTDISSKIKEKFIAHPDFSKLGGCRLGPYAFGNLYNKHCVLNIFKLIDKYGIDRNLDHFISNIKTSPDKKNLESVFHISLKGVDLCVHSAKDNNGIKLQDKPIKIK